MISIGRWFIVCCVFGQLCGCVHSSSPSPTLTDKVGQLVMVGFRGTEVDATSPVVRDLVQWNLGGVILFDEDVALSEPVRNVVSPEQLSTLTSRLQSFSSSPLLIAIDQEGGRVNRLKPSMGFPETQSHQRLGEGSPDSTYEKTLPLATALRQAGINLNLGPVVDLSVRPDNFIVKKERTFSADPRQVVLHATAYMRAHDEAGVLCALKHFPGHGSSKSDSHLGMADVTKTWSAAELEPYRELCASAPVVMTAHVFQRNLDSEWPATLSKKIITGLLRDDMGYDGVVMSDDLAMHAIAGHYGFEAAVEHALNAGVDLLLVANNTDYDPDIVEKTVKTILELVRSGRVSEERVNEAFKRVSRLKDKI